MNWLARMMYGRYGTDQLGFFTLLLMLILNMVFAFTGWDALYILSFALAILSIFRIFSKNHLSEVPPRICEKKLKEQLPVFLPAAAEGQGVFAL